MDLIDIHQELQCSGSIPLLKVDGTSILAPAEQPNKALEPTPTSVMPPAFAGVTPAGVVAHL